jgi:hypothetical protein
LAALLSAAVVDAAVFGLAVSAAARLFAAFVNLVDGRPGAAFRLVLGHAAALVTFLDVFGLPFLLFGILRFVASGHDLAPFARISARKAAISIPCASPKQTDFPFTSTRIRYNLVSPDPFNHDDDSF